MTFYLNDSYVIDTLLEHHLTRLTLLILFSCEIVHQFRDKLLEAPFKLSSLQLDEILRRKQICGH